MTVSRRARSWIIGVLAVALLGLAVAWAIGPSDSPTEDAGSDGYLGLRLLLQQQGATVTDVDGGDVTASLAKRYDVVFVLRSNGVDRAQLAEWHRYVAAGGRLVLGEPDTQRPTDADAPEPAAIVAPGSCNIDGGGQIESVHADGIAAHHVHAGEQSCFGNAAAALLTSATCQRGAQYTLSSPTIFDNQTMGAPTEDRLTPDRRGNATLATLVLAPGDHARVAIVTDGVDLSFGDTGPAKNEPKCADAYDDDALWQDPTATGPGTDRASGSTPGGTAPGGTTPGGTTPGGTTPGGTTPGGTTPGGSTPSGSVPGGSIPGGSGGDNQSGSGGSGSQQDDSPEAGTAKPPPTLFDFLSPGLKLALAQLLAVLAWYAWRRSRRRGVVVEDEKPVELRSSRLVEAVGALRRRGGETERAGQELRDRTRAQLAASLGLGPDVGAADVAAALAPRLGRPVDDVSSLLLGPPIETEESLVALAARLHALRTDLAASLTTSSGRS